jgi:hypothetical protein
MFGPVRGWFYNKYVPGIIMPSMPGFSHIQIKPNALCLDNVLATIDLPHGLVAYHSITTRKEMELWGCQPPGASATFLVQVAIDNKRMERTWTEIYWKSINENKPHLCVGASQVCCL